jgi:acetyl-CoA carboxylase biotin carboxyl carrier protein
MDNITNDDLTWLMQVLEGEQLGEVEVAIGEDRVVLRAATGPVSPATWAPAGLPQAPAPLPWVPEGAEVLRSPMAGIFYRRPSPDQPSYVEPGDEVQVSDTVGLIEAMKLFSEITSHLHGRIVKFIPEEGQHVAADAPLVLIEPFHSRD